MSHGPQCPYCKGRTALLTGDEVYPHKPGLRNRKFWVCRPCDARVGCHPGTETPLGSLADRRLRRARMRAHAVFDPKWQLHPRPTQARTLAYRMLADRLGIPVKDCHIGSMDEAQCERVIEFCTEVHDDVEV